MSMTQRYAGMLRRHAAEWERQGMPVQAEATRQAARHMEDRERELIEEVARAVAAERAGWVRAIDEAMVCSHIGIFNDGDEPRDALNKVLAWHQQIALDPAVSSEARALVDAERERCAKLCEEIESQAYALWRAMADPTEQGRSLGAQHCADAIRAESAP